MQIDWDDAYANMAHIAGSEALPAQWASDASAFRQSGVTIEADLTYGPAPREIFDLILPEGAPRGLVMIIHGGYWMRTSKSDWTHLAEGAVRRGWAVAMPSYTLTPEIDIPGITRQIATALDVAAQMVPGPIRVAGHSAGGHLAARMACTNSPISAGIAGRIERVFPISGVFDLRPLIQTGMNDTLGLDLMSARAESPALLEPRAGTKITMWVGGDERPEFIRQSELLDNVWRGFDVTTDLRVDHGYHHFSVLDGLRDPESPIAEAAFG